MQRRLATVACTAHVYVVPNGGAVGDSTRMFNVALTAKETILIEPSYPIVLEDTGDTIQLVLDMDLSTYWLMVIRRFDRCLHLNLLQVEH